MATLHSLQHGIDDQNWLGRCLASVKAGDGIILLEDAVTISCHLPTLQQFHTLDVELSFYVLDIDLEVRGIKAQIGKQFEVLSYQEFVELTLQYDKVVNWA